MKMRTKRLVSVIALSAGLELMVGCQQVSQLKVLFTKRPSEDLPAYKPVDVRFLDQHWSGSQRQTFYHTPQGTEVMPYKWFLALEQPGIKVFGTVPMFAETSYMARFGFLPNGVDAGNPDGLPVGFAKASIVDPHTGVALDVVGFTCAACHTGQVEYRGKGVRIDGGSAAADLSAFQNEVAYAVGFTDKIPFRFGRFAKRVLGEDASSEEKKRLREQLRAFISAGQTEFKLDEDRKLYASSGFGRTDALGRIGNFVFGTELDNVNLRVANAPVKLPPLWYTSWFGWVQYNGSIQQPMSRNVGESLGVRARVNLTDRAKLFESTVSVKDLWDIEELLAGEKMFEGLKAPAWPEDVLGPIDRAKAAQGASLYKQHCEQCHLPSVKSPDIQDAAYWEPGLAGRRFLKLKLIPLEEIGTDPREAIDWANRTAVTGALGLGTVPATVGLRLVTAKVRDLEYDKMNFSQEQRMEWNGYREDGVTAPLAYRARPLEGMWATPPFLHNGSVPNLYELLSPVEERSKTFYRGSREFDPKRVGYEQSKIDGGFLFSTDQPGDPHPGNSNAGHEFRNGSGKGVIGPQLTEAERWAIIEYLKIL
ncbi:di-heme-cytochrome C peroxidase [Granulicella sp. dw_53]|uniref:di-heme-cytochrome C peroxidase n=1 Tax=Granulicella sp. dw_53 TaxID=2719792 RepID=UPI001BD238DD|nr:di-heme-cytochrome C peroxidase [Granulicella sp. dw_53]